MTRCEHQNYRNFRYVQCNNRAKVEVDGKSYCGVHDPAKVKTRRATWAARWEVESKVRHLQVEVEHAEGLLVDWARKNVHSNLVETLEHLHRELAAAKAELEQKR